MTTPYLPENSESPYDYYSCAVFFRRYEDNLVLCIWDKRQDPEHFTFYATLPADRIHELTDTLLALPVGQELFLGGMTPEDAMAFAQTGERSLGTTLPPEKRDE